MEIIRYEIQERKFSSNAIQGIYVDEKGNQHKEVMVMFGSMKKKDGDQKAIEITNHLNNNIIMNQEYPF